MEKIKLVPYDLNSLQEAEELHSIIQEYFKQSPWAPTIEQIMRKGVFYYRAFLNDDQVGITGLVLRTPNLAETVKTTVFNNWRNKGFGKAISEAIEEECKGIGVKKVMTTIYHFNHVMIGIKLKQGYTIEGYHPDHEAPGFHEYSLGKVLK